MEISHTVAPVPSLPNFGVEDIPHLGRFAARLRLSRGIENVKQLAGALHISPAVISRFERGINLRSAYFQQFVQALQNPQIGDIVINNPLTPIEAELLFDLEVQNRTRARRRNLYENLNELKLDNLYRRIGPTPSTKSRSKNLQDAPTYAQIIRQLEAQTNPAFVADRLWNIHAINGAAFRLFNIDAGSPSGSKYLKRWEAWHVLAAKFTEPSPVRDHTNEINRYFPPTVDAFFRDVYPFLFTPQARALLSRLHAMSRQNSLGFGRMWDSSVTLTSFLEQDKALYRGIVFQGTEVQAIAQSREEWFVYPNSRQPVLYWMGLWEPNENDDRAKAAFAKLQDYSDSRTIYYAAQYDSLETPFHPSEWPEVIALGTHLEDTSSF